MADFFARLAGRAADLPAPGPVVRPRLPHLFERPQPAPAEVIEVTWPERDGTPPPVRPATAPPAPAVPAHTPLPPPPTTPGRVDREVVTDRTVTTVESVSSVRQVVERLRLTEGPALVPPPVVAPTRTAPPHDPAGPPSAPPPPAGRTVQRPHADAVLPARRSDLAPARPRPPEPERVVHISIGRLEVLGGRPEPRRTAARSERPAPLLPLNNYLAGEGGRR